MIDLTLDEDEEHDEQLKRALALSVEGQPDAPPASSSTGARADNDKWAVVPFKGDTSEQPPEYHLPAGVLGDGDDAAAAAALSREDRDIAAAMAASMEDDRSAAAQEEAAWKALPLSARYRKDARWAPAALVYPRHSSLCGRPMAFRAPRPEDTYAVLALAALAAVPQLHNALAAWMPGSDGPEGARARGRPRTR
jgi:hypothetical protein